MGFRFIHAADLHLDTPFNGIGQVAPELTEVMRDASLTAFDRLVKLAIREQVLFVVLSGDIFDAADRGLRAELAFRSGLQRLSDARIRTFVAYGNHDPLDGWQTIKDWPERVTIFAPHHAQSFAVTQGEAVVATVHGVSYAQRETRDDLSLTFRRTDSPGVHIGVLHCNVAGKPGHSDYSPCSVQGLLDRGMDYWALGHIHTRQTLTDRAPWICYPGNLQGLSPKPGELGPKGALVVDVDGGIVQAPRFEALAPVEFQELAVDIDPFQDPGALIDGLRLMAAAARSTAKADQLILRVVLTGRGELHRHLVRTGAIAAVLEALRANRDGCWWESLRDDSRLPLDLAEIRQRDDLAAAVLRQVDQYKSDSAALAGLLSGLKEPWPRPAAPSVDPAADPALLDDALRLAIDLLESGVEG